MNQNRLILLNCVLNKVKYSFCSCIFSIEYDLVFEIKPLESQIYYSSTFPMIWNLFSSTVNNMSNLIGNHKFLILFRKSSNYCSYTYLSGKTVTYEQPIFDFDGTNHLFWHRLHHFHLFLLLEHLHLLLIHFLLLLTSVSWVILLITRT